MQENTVVKDEGQDSIIVRLALYTFWLNFSHPQSQIAMTIEVPYPDDFSFAIKNQLLAARNLNNSWQYC